MSETRGDDKIGSKDDRNTSSGKSRRNTRGSIEIIADILPLCTSGTKRTHIMYKANLSYEMLKFYIRYMLEIGLLEERNMEIRTTDKGNQFLHHYKNMTRLLDSFNQNA